MQMPRRKHIRMSPLVYREPGRIFSVTIAMAARSPVFTDIEFGLECIDLLRTICNEYRLRVYAYCLMPDHVHLLLGLGPASDLVPLIGRWKSLCSLVHRRKGLSPQIWQRSFHDHALRKEEDVAVVVHYILENPVRAGLVEKASEHILSGSFEVHLDDAGRPQGSPLHATNAPSV
jgi:REP element-mobilizing transposase RayT